MAAIDTSPAGCSDVSADSSSSSLEKTPSRKRKKNIEEWIKTKRKCLRNSGKEYVATSKKTVSLYVFLLLLLMVVYA